MAYGPEKFPGLSRNGPLVFIYINVILDEINDCPANSKQAFKKDM